VVFVSYEKSDVGLAHEIRAHLEAGGFACWMAPDDVRGPVPWPEQVEQAIESCDVMLVVVSANASASQHVSREVDLAVEKAKPLLPVRVEDVVPTGTLNYLLRLAQWIDLFPGSISDHATALQGMVGSMLTDRGLAAPPPPKVRERPRRQLSQKTIVGAGVVALVAAALGLGLFLGGGDGAEDAAEVAPGVDPATAEQPEGSDLSPDDAVSEAPAEGTVAPEELAAAPSGSVPASPAAAQQPGGAFGRHYYMLIEEPATWHDAVAYCKQHGYGGGGYLVTINSAEENQFVYDLLPSDWSGAWLGATDEAVEGTWRWVTGEPFDYTNWNSTEPNDFAAGPDPTRGEDYVDIGGPWLAQQDRTLWFDWQYEDDGSESALPFVCEYEPDPGIGVFVGPDFSTLYVAGWNFIGNSTVTMQIDHGADGSVDYQDQGVASGIDAYVRFDAALKFTVAEGDLVRLADDSGYAKEMIAQYITLDLLDPVNDVLAGNARAGTEFGVYIGTVDVNAHPTNVVADADGQWSVDLGAFGFDLEPGMQGWLELVDPDKLGVNSADYTWLSWTVRSTGSPSPGPP
jgi:hypothetical protein